MKPPSPCRPLQPPPSSPSPIPELDARPGARPGRHRVTGRGPAPALPTASHGRRRALPHAPGHPQAQEDEGRQAGGGCTGGGAAGCALALALKRNAPHLPAPWPCRTVCRRYHGGRRAGAVRLGESRTARDAALGSGAGPPHPPAGAPQRPVGPTGRPAPGPPHGGPQLPSRPAVGAAPRGSCVVSPRACPPAPCSPPSKLPQW